MHSDQLRYLIELSKNPSLNATSEKLNISYPGLSRSISTLEKELGISLIVRSNKGVTLTKEGKKLVKLSQSFLNDVNALIESTKTHVRGTVEFITSSFFVENILADIIIDLRQKNSSLHLQYQLNDNTKNTLINLTQKRDIFAIQYIPITPEIYNRNPNIIFNEFFTSQSYCVCSKTHPLAKHKSLSYKDLKKHTYINRQPDNVELKPYFSGKEIVTNNLVLFNKYISSGIAFSFGVAVPIPPYVYPTLEDTVTIPITDMPSYSLCLIHHRDFKMNSATEFFLNFVLNKMGISPKL